MKNNSKEEEFESESSLRSLCEEIMNSKSKKEEFERLLEAIILRDIRQKRIKKLFDLQPNIDENKKIKMEKKAE